MRHKVLKVLLKNPKMFRIILTHSILCNTRAIWICLIRRLIMLIILKMTIMITELNWLFTIKYAP